jgi:hypothetical protein
MIKTARDIEITPIHIDDASFMYFRGGRINFLLKNSESTKESARNKKNKKRICLCWCERLKPLAMLAYM